MADTKISERPDHGALAPGDIVVANRVVGENTVTGRAEVPALRSYAFSVSGRELVLSDGGGTEVARVSEADLRTLLTNLGVIHA